MSTREQSTGPPQARVSHGIRRPTMADVAALAGVALKTVSRVVNAEPSVTPETADRVRAAIAELGFRRNDSARAVRKGQTASIGLVLENIGDPFYSLLARSVEDVARARGHVLFTGSSDESPAREEEIALAFCARRVDGLILVPASDDHTYLEPEIAAGLAAVFVDRPPRHIDADTVLSDNAGGARQGVMHLIGSGHRKIGFIGDAPQIWTSVQRHDGYTGAMAAAGLKVNSKWVTQAPPTEESVAKALRKMLAAGATAVLCGNNRISVTALRALTQMGNPDLAFVGFDDFELADMLTPGVTVVAQDVASVGRVAAELLFRRLDGDRRPAERIEIATRLIPRGSGEIAPR